MKINDYSKLNVNKETKTNDIITIQDKTGNLYESINIIAKRANDISVELKKEFNERVEEFTFTNDILEEIFENKEQIKISKMYEKIPKSTLIATREFLDDNLDYNYKDKK